MGIGTGVGQARRAARSLPVALAFTAIALAVGLVGCDRTTTGSVAMTTEPGPPLTSPRPSAILPTLPLPGLPGVPLPLPGFPTRPRPTTSGPPVPVPGDPMTITCSQYDGLTDAQKQAVVEAILARGKSPLGPDGNDVAKVIADATCTFLPSAPVSGILLGTPPP